MANVFDLDIDNPDKKFFALKRTAAISQVICRVLEDEPGNEEERNFLSEILKKDKRNEDDFSETLALINKYKAIEASLKRAEYFVNVSYDALGIFEDCEEKRVLQNLTGFSLNRSF